MDKKSNDTQRNIYKNLPYPQISDAYKMQKMISDEENCVYDYSSLSVMPYINKHVNMKGYYPNVVFQLLSNEYLESALVLSQRVIEEREINSSECVALSLYTTPCAFLCRHAIELKLKQCLCDQGNADFATHDLVELWNKIERYDLDNNIVCSIDSFIKDMKFVDQTEQSLRYGVDKNGDPMPYGNFNCVAIINNTKFLFNQIHKISHK